jgi:hypothetical protein
MTIDNSERIKAELPSLVADGFEITSPIDIRYNCIAWAAGDTDRFWWPSVGSGHFWPPQAPQAVSLDAFIAAFGSLGFSPCENGVHQDGTEKIVIYAGTAGPTHAARQLPSGEWTSKLGRAHDIRHSTPEGVCGSLYGDIAVFMARSLEVHTQTPG